MLLLTATTDTVEIVTAAAVTVDVHVSYMDYASGTVTPDRQNTAITTATTTTVVSAPAASTTRNVKTLTARNRSGANIDLKVQFNQNGTRYELFQATLLPNQTLQFKDGVGFGIVSTSTTALVLTNANTSDVTANAADTYLTGSSLNIGGRIQSGTFFRWRFAATKTGAGTATPIWNVRFGTAGTTADTSRLTATGVAQTAATDTGWFEIEAVVRNVSSTGTVAGFFRFAHKNATTGFANVAQDQMFQVSSATFDLTVSNLIVGVSVNPGTAGVWTFQIVDVRAFNID